MVLTCFAAGWADDESWSASGEGAKVGEVSSRDAFGGGVKAFGRLGSSPAQVKDVRWACVSKKGNGMIENAVLQRDPISNDSRSPRKAMLRSRSRKRKMPSRAPTESAFNPP